MAGTYRSSTGTAETVDVGLLLRWGAFAVLLALLGLVLASRAGDAYTELAGLLFAGFSVLIGFRLVARLTP
jgi:hypothetical protein